MSAPFMTAEDIQSFKDYVKLDNSSLNTASSTVIVNVTHSHLQQHFSEIRLDKHMTIEAVKRKLSTMCGTSTTNMLLKLQDQEGKTICTLSADEKPFGFYSPYSGCTLHVVDLDPASLSAQGWLEDLSKVEKYVMKDEDYDKRQGTVRKFKEAMIQRQAAAAGGNQDAAEATVSGDQSSGAGPATGSDGRDAAPTITIGDRCSVDPGDKRGCVRFVGPVPELPGAGTWVGVEYDEPLGKNDGSIKGKRYFQCGDNYGGFLRPDKVKVGDYPPFDDDGLDSGDEI